MQTIWLNSFVVSVYDRLTDQDHWRRQIASTMDRVGPLPPNVRVLDLGTGPGVSAFVLASRLGPAARVTGVDFSEKMIAIARERHRARYASLANVDFIQADAAAVPFSDASFDLVVGHSVLYLTGNRKKVLAEMRRVLAPGGSLIVMEPNENGSLWRSALAAVPAIPAHLRTPFASLRFASSMVSWRFVAARAGRITDAALETLIREAGFDSASCTPALGGLGLHGVGRINAMS
ncbi:MAG: methyltransferase domain-containing protein [Deltaproteobacteria bacterium]|nr:methyltransferase domain-containing protein [Deltaproteobacteria bacterium]